MALGQMYRTRTARGAKKQLITKRTYNNRRYKKAYRSMTYTPNIRLGNSGLPRTLSAKLNYAQQFNLSPASNGIATKVFSVNGITACNITDNLGQPYMRDQWIAFFHHYRVFGCKIRAYITSDSSADGLVTLRASNLSTAPADINLEIQRGAISKVVTTDRPTYIKAYMAVNKIFGVSRKRVAEDDLFSSSVTGSPNFECYSLFAAQSADVATGCQLNVRIKITYYVKFFDNLDQQAS